jgi:two-component system, sensor histidine kinase YesM
MNKLKGHFSSFKLNSKITLLIIGIIVIPMIVLSTLFFENIRGSRIRERMKNVEVNFTQNYGEIEKKVEMGILSTQSIINSSNFWSNVAKYDTEEKVTVVDLLDFYKNDIASIEKLVNSNPYLYQIRIYVDSDSIPEMMPILYHKDRMMRLSWAQGEFISGTWQYDYVDTTFAASRSSRHLVSYVTVINKNQIDAVIEVSLRMETLFPDMYTSTEDEWTCFVDGNGNYYYNTNYSSKWENSISEIYENMENNSSGYSEVKEIDGTPVIINYKPIYVLNGYLIKIVSIKDDIKSVDQLRNIFWVCFLAIVIVLIWLSNKIVKVILRQFYVVTGTVQDVQNGNLEVRIPNCGNDEIGELGKQINKMMDRITQLMDDNIKREILIKDSQIRALQNQINAHFIYNVLESIKMMAEIEEKYDISNAVTSLGKLLRYSMKWVSKNVTVEEEIDYIKNYLALINLRFDYEIYLSLNIPEKIYKQKIPKMSLQPIIENAIYHGIEGLAEDTNIYMKGILYDDYCVIEITDAGRGMSEEEVLELQQKINGEIETTGSSGNGIGLKNVQDRIKISFGENYGISISSKKGCYTKVIVKIPLA